MLATLTTQDAVTLSVTVVVAGCVVLYAIRTAYLVWDTNRKARAAAKAARQACKDGEKHDWGNWEVGTLKTKLLTPSAWCEGVHTATETIQRVERRTCVKCNKMDERLLGS
jgi:hypothetical protein